MFAQIFGKYLVENDIVNKYSMEEIMDKLNNTRVKLGTIAVAEGYMTETQAIEVNKIQASRDAKFGDIAIEKGYLSKEQLETILSKQGNESMKFIQLLNEEAGLMMDSIEDELCEFKKFNGYDDYELEALKNDDIDVIISLYAVSSNPLVTELADIVMKNITRFVTEDFYFDRMHKVSEYSYKAFTGQRIFGDNRMFVGFASDEEGNNILAKGYANEVSLEDDVEVYDAISEFTNLNSGLFATALSRRKIAADMEIPVVFENESITGKAYVMPIYIKGKQVDLIISVDENFVPGRKYRSVTKKAELGDGIGDVLIVDDSALIRKVLRNIFESNGYKVAGEACNGIEALEMFMAYRPAMVTLDITMPKMDGVDALKQIKKVDANAKVVMITAAGQESKVITALKEGAMEFITKPINKDVVLKQAKMILGR